MQTPESSKRLVENSPVQPPETAYFTPYQPSFAANSAAVSSAHESLSVQSTTLHETSGIAAQSDMLGASILDSLRRQREQLEHTSANLDHADTNMDSSSKLITNMVSRFYFLYIKFHLITF